MTGFNCRSCAAPLREQFVDLGLSPVSNHYPSLSDFHLGQMVYPLTAWVCQECWLVQLDSSIDRSAHFNDEYAYFSSVSSTWLAHLETFVTMVRERGWIAQHDLVCEVASNDGCLLELFNRIDTQRVIGVEPSASVAEHAEKEYGVPTEVMFMERSNVDRFLARHGKANLVIANNVLAHVPDMNDFIGGIAGILDPKGLVSIEFPSVTSILQSKQFDTIYHEHYSYLCLTSVEPVLHRAGLHVIEVQNLPTHGGSLRLICANASSDHAIDLSVDAQRDAEGLAGVTSIDAYRSAASQIAQHRRDIISYLVDLKANAKSIAAYGAPAKASTLCSYTGIGHGFFDFACDMSASKQQRYIPGTSILIDTPDRVFRDRPDVVVIFAWNIWPEIVRQLSERIDWDVEFCILVPEIRTVATQHGPVA